MRAAPVNPADINAIEGKYPARREVRRFRDLKARASLSNSARMLKANEARW